MTTNNCLFLFQTSVKLTEFVKEEPMTEIKNMRHIIKTTPKEESKENRRSGNH